MTNETALPSEESALAVFRNRPFLLLWIAQAATQIGGNMVIFGLTVIISKATGSVSAVSALILTFLVPAVLFSAVAGVFVDRLDRRLVLIVTNVLRGAAFVAVFLVGNNLILIYLLNIFISTVTVFFAPAEAAMIPKLLPKRQLLAANGIFTLTLNAAFALGFALLGPLVVKIAGAAGAADPRRRPVLRRGCLLFHAAVVCTAHAGAPGVRSQDGERDRAGCRIDLLPAPRGPRLHPPPPGDPLVADLPRGRRVSRRRAGRARAGLRRDDARAPGGGLRRRRPAARDRHRHGHPAAQHLRQAAAATAGHRGRAGRARVPHPRDGPVRADQQLPRRRPRRPPGSRTCRC